MMRAACVAVAGAALALAAAPDRAAAQGGRERSEFQYFDQSGPQFAVDHWRYDPIVNFGTNPGVGWRWDLDFSRAIAFDMAMNFFKHSIPGAYWSKTVYLEAAASLLVTPFDLSRPWAPYFGGGWTAIATGGDEAGNSPFILAGVRKPGRRWTPYLELELTTKRSRFSVTLGIFHRKTD